MKPLRGPCRSQGSCQFLQRIDKGFVISAGREIEANFTCAIAAEIGIEFAPTHFICLLGGCRSSELSVEKATVASKGATASGYRCDCLVRHGGCEPMQFIRELEVIDRAARMHHRGFELVPDIELRQQPIVRPSDRIENRQLSVTCAIVGRQILDYLAGDAERARARVADDRQPAAVAPAPQAFRGAVGHDVLPLL